eukprot:9664836-Alexandrium_andersonii.AAC.1
MHIYGHFGSSCSRRRGCGLRVDRPAVPPGCHSLPAARLGWDCSPRCGSAWRVADAREFSGLLLSL